MLRRLPQAAELAINALAMTAVFTIVAASFSASLVIGAIFEFRRLIGGRVLGSFLLGTHHRPRREQRIVMFLDIAGSTALVEQLGEVRVHDLITRFSSDIDRPIAGHDGEVHAYVGDEVIVTWPLSEDPKRNADRCAASSPPKTVSRILRRTTLANSALHRTAPTFTPGRPCSPRPTALTGTGIPPGLTGGSPTNLTLRGRQPPVEAHAVRRNHEVCRRAAHAPTPD
jgi:hypothetical protein